MKKTFTRTKAIRVYSNAKAPVLGSVNSLVSINTFRWINLLDIFVSRAETRRKGMRTGESGWWNLEENKNPEEGCFWRRADQNVIFKYRLFCRKALLSGIRETLIVSEADKGKAESLSNADFSGYKSDHWRVSSTLKISTPDHLGLVPGARAQASEGE